MINPNIEVANAVKSNSDALQKTLWRFVKPSSGNPDTHILQQFRTAIELLSIVLAKDGVRFASQHFGGWLKITVNQSPAKFIAEPFRAHSFHDI